MTLTTVCFLHLFLFMFWKVGNHAVRYLVCAVPFILDVLQFFVHPLLSVDFDGQVKHNQKAAAGFEQKKHAETAE